MMTNYEERHSYVPESECILFVQVFVFSPTATTTVTSKDDSLLRTATTKTPAQASDLGGG